MKRIKLYAYLIQNLGDDLMVHILLKRYPEYLFFSDNWDENSIFLQYPNYMSLGGTQKKFGRINHIFNLLTLNKKKDFLMGLIRSKLNKCDCSVFIGGSLYQQGNSEDFGGWLKYEEKKLEQSPLFVIGANFGPYTTEDFRIAFSEYFRKCGGITFRDQASYEMFPDNDRVAYAPDVVFNLEIPNSVEKSGTVLISVIDVMGRSNLCPWADTYYLRIKELCEVCLARGKTPVLMSFCKLEGDEVAVQKILNMLPEDIRRSTKCFLYRGNIHEALELYRAADCIIATRFHAMILAMKFKKPFYSISYSPKVKHVLQDIGLNCYCELMDLEQLSAEQMIDSCQKANVQEYVQMAELQFAQFEAYMKKER